VQINYEYVAPNKNIFYQGVIYMVEKRIRNRIKEEAIYIINTKKTLREVAKEFKVSKSTIHKDMRNTIEKEYPELFYQVNKILEEHLKTRHINGGLATKIKYLNK
jgi:putative DeoR family transcriptional regulator (stage III sporulation protein D)